MDRNRELVPDNWNLVRERALITGLCLEGWYSEHSGVCRRVDSFMPSGCHMTSSPAFFLFGLELFMLAYTWGELFIKMKGFG